jgi:hypothetical protein
MNLKKLTYSNFKEGLYSVTPLQLCTSRIYGYIGTMLGAFITMLPLLLTHQWGWSIFIFFVLWLQCSALVGDLQQRKILIESEEQIARAMTQLNEINKVKQ